MTNQEIFNTVYAHLMAMDERSSIPSEDEGLFCAYRGDEGRKCAIGCLIPDELYVPEIENTTVFSAKEREGSGIALRGILDQIGVEVEQYDLLDALQSVHDAFFFMKERRLRMVAEDFNLEVPQ